MSTGEKDTKSPSRRSGRGEEGVDVSPGDNPEPTGEGGDLGGFHILPRCSLTNKRMIIRRRKEETTMAATATVGAEEGERKE